MLEIYGWTAIKNSVNSNLANQIQSVIQRWIRTIFKKMIHSPNLKTNWRAHLQHGSYQIWEFFPDFRIIWSREKLRRIIWSREKLRSFLVVPSYVITVDKMLYFICKDQSLAHNTVCKYSNTELLLYWK